MVPSAAEGRAVCMLVSVCGLVAGGIGREVAEAWWTEGTRCKSGRSN